jgi:hypothetical protein
VNGLLLRLLSGHVSVTHWAARAASGFVSGHAGELEVAGLVLAVLVGFIGLCSPARRGLSRATVRLFLGLTWRRAVRHAGVVGTDGGVPSLSHIRAVPAGHRMQAHLPHGSHATALANGAEAIAASMGVREVRVIRDAANAGVAWVSVVRRDPLASATPLAWPWLGRESVSLWDAVPVGADEDGRPVSLGLPWHNVLAGGEPGAGKSAALNMLVAAAALDPSVRLTLLDGKLVELAVWRRCAEACVGVSIADAIDALRAEQAVMDERYLAFPLGKRKVTPGDGFGLHVIVIDELAHYLTSGDRKETAEVANRLRDLVSRGQPSGIASDATFRSGEGTLRLLRSGSPG